VNRISVSKLMTALAIFTGLSCGGSASSDVPVGAAAAAAQEMSGERITGDLPPGFGTLKQDAFTIPMVYEGLAIKVTPLREWVIRLAAPDTYRRLSGYKTSLAGEIEALARKKGQSEWPQLMLVSLFTRTPEQVYEPMELEVTNGNSVYRPIGVIPISPEFGKGRVQQNQTLLAIYLFPSQIDLDLTLILRYRETRGVAWESIQQKLYRERALVRSRVASSQGTQGE
jgi:hypothetical protein